MKKITKTISIFISISLFFLPLLAEQNTPITKEEKLLVYNSILGALGSIGDPSTKKIFIKALKSKEYIIRLCALSGLGTLKDKEDIPLLKELLSDENAYMKVLTVKTLIDLGDTDMEGSLLNFLSDTDPSIRATAASYLGGFGEKYLPTLLNFLNDTDPSVRSTAVSYLGGFGEKYLPRLYEILLKDDSNIVRATIISILGANKYEPAKEYILNALQDKNTSIRLAATSVISQIGLEQTTPLLLKMMNDADVSIRAAAKEALSVIQEKSIVDMCWKDIEDKDPSLRKSSYVALANLKDVNVLPVLLKNIVAADSSLYIREGAAQALVILKPYLEELISKGLLAIKADMLAVENLAVSYKVDGKDLALTFIEALKDKNNPLYEDAPFVIAYLQERSDLSVLRETLLDNDPIMVAAAAYCLGVLQDKEAVSYLLKISKKYEL
jgi:HEAT repeat protein